MRASGGQRRTALPRGPASTSGRSWGSGCYARSRSRAIGACPAPSSRRCPAVRRGPTDRVHATERNLERAPPVFGGMKTNALTVHRGHRRRSRRCPSRRPPPRRRRASSPTTARRPPTTGLEPEPEHALRLLALGLSPFDRERMIDEMTAQVLARLERGGGRGVAARGPGLRRGRAGGVPAARAAGAAPRRGDVAGRAGGDRPRGGGARGCARPRVVPRDGLHGDALRRLARSTARWRSRAPATRPARTRRRSCARRRGCWRRAGGWWSPTAS